MDKARIIRELTTRFSCRYEIARFFFDEKFSSREMFICDREISKKDGYISKKIEENTLWRRCFSEKAKGQYIILPYFFTLISGMASSPMPSPVSEPEPVVAADGGGEGSDAAPPVFILDDAERLLTFQAFIEDTLYGGEDILTSKDWEDAKTRAPFYHAVSDGILSKDRAFKTNIMISERTDSVPMHILYGVHCVECGKDYSVPAKEFESMPTYSCREKRRNTKGELVACKRTLSNPISKESKLMYGYNGMIPKSNTDGSSSFERIPISSFSLLSVGFYEAVCIGVSTSGKDSGTYILVMDAKRIESGIPFTTTNAEAKTGILTIEQDIFDYIVRCGYHLNRDQARLPFLLETLKRCLVLFDPSLNISHSLYFGAPGIGKTQALKLLHRVFYSDRTEIDGPRFSIAGLTGGEHDVVLNGKTRRRQSIGALSREAFVFDEMNNKKFMEDDGAVETLKAVLFEQNGNVGTVSGKSYIRSALVAGTANYSAQVMIDYRKRITRNYRDVITAETKKITGSGHTLEGAELNALLNMKGRLAAGRLGADIADLWDVLDIYAPSKEQMFDDDTSLLLYDEFTRKCAWRAIEQARKDYPIWMCGFQPAFLQRFFFTVLLHPKHDKAFERVSVSEDDPYSERPDEFVNEAYRQAQMYSKDCRDYLVRRIAEGKAIFYAASEEARKKYSRDMADFLRRCAERYPAFYILNRNGKIPKGMLHLLTALEKETRLTEETKHVFERIISLLHTPISTEEFHTLCWDKMRYIQEGKP